MNKDNGLRILLALVVLALCVWLGQALEWVEVETQEPDQGLAATNPWYATQRLITLLGGRVVPSDSLRDMPPAQATLLLQSAHWSLFPDYPQRLRQWVEHGGHLVVPAYFLEQEKFQQWVPIQLAELPENAAKPRPLPRPVPANPKRNCHDVVEQRAGDSTDMPGRKLQLCGYTNYTLQTAEPIAWGISGSTGYEGLRIALGQGSVTVLSPNGIGMRREPLQEDNALILLAALDLRAHAEVWFVLDEKRPPLLSWIWTQGWHAVLLCLVALALALWRGMARFGPISVPPETARRSMAEQVRGTAQFLRRAGANGLHQAQLRALDDMAARHLRNYRSQHAAERAQNIAQATQLDASALARAMRSDIQRTPHALYQALQLLESARRRLRQASSAATPSSPS